MVNFKTQNVTALLVDDAQVNLLIGEELLVNYGIKVIKAIDGVDALRKVVKIPFDIIFMDHMMPNMDGVEATKEIRSIPGEQFKSLPIIALTANENEDMLSVFIEAGMNAIISKPIQVEKLESVLRKYLAEEKIIAG